ncbi:Na+/H+ antiporter [Taibaiella soli]|uniref:Na+/H+ antiporter n=1 Tax=Taibaiella soli TaxID=1649169 RepID=A0A2W2B3D0_9BACT|nr:Na+/H+ antiporter [Taibaiella soli]PZF74794.1 Na+/H+ antiporter [Taibaiella soli]
MENYSVVIFIMAIMIALSAVAKKINIPYPVLLIIAGIAIGFIPAVPEIVLNSEVVFLIFLPPLLYDAAFNISFQDFRTHLNTISTLAVGLVFLTTIGVAIVAHFIIPGMSWPLTFVLGAILSATDAVAAIGITKGLGLSHKTVTILEGESLVNDASALVAYRFAVAAVTGTAFVLWKATLHFAVLMSGGFVVGFVLGKTLAFVLKRVYGNPLVTVSLMLLAPFVAYLLAESFHVSGVIAVVIIGIGSSRFSDRVFPEQLKQQSKSFWDVIIFLLNGLIFILIGLEFPYVVKDVSNHKIWSLIGYSLIITVVALLIRMARVFLQKLNLQNTFKKRKQKIPREALLDFQTSVIISWSGMRGIVSLAIALGLPTKLENGTPFPMRSDIIFISVAVVLFTLIGQGLTLPWVVKRMSRIQK